MAGAGQLTPARLRFAPQILERLGEELVPHPDQGILELVKNAYDADAKSCTVSLIDTLEFGGQIRVRDNGDGMSGEQITEGWLVLGRSTKNPSRRSRLRRLPVGEKGLGRLAALRLGDHAVLRTRPREEPGTEYTLEIEWSRFSVATTVEEVEFVVHSAVTTEPPGTDIEINDLTVRLTRRDVKRLARSMVLLKDPFSTAGNFTPRLDAEDFTDLAHLVSQGYFDETWYRITASLDKSGKLKLRAEDHLTGWRLEATTSEMTAALGHECTYEAPPAKFDLWVFNLSGPLPSGNPAMTLGGLREWLGAVGGVHIYHRGLRVQPYGDPGSDWLDMNLRRARSPEERPSTNNSVGRVTIEDPTTRLTQKTDRSGFIEDDAFHELTRFGQDVMDYVARERVREAERRRDRERKQTPAARQAAWQALTDVVERLPVAERRTIEPKLRAAERATDRERETLISDVELYRTLGTIGTTTALIAHEAYNPSLTIIKMTDSIEKRAKSQLGDAYNRTLGPPIGVLRKAADRLHVYSVLPRRLLDQRKRTVQEVELYSALRDTLDIYRPILDEHNVAVELRLDSASPKIRARPASVEAITGNIVLNAVAALDKQSESQRVLSIAGAVRDGMLSLTFMDNGPGIVGLTLGDIWLPGRTTTPTGTGLGLTIVRDAVGDLRGRVSATEHGDLGGAAFTIDLPVLVN